MKRVPAQPLLNKLAFNGYHIQGEYYAPQYNSRQSRWIPFHDHYHTLTEYIYSFSSVGEGVFSPREIYLQQLEDHFYRDIVIRDNDAVVLWDATIEEEFKRGKRAL